MYYTHTHIPDQSHIYVKSMPCASVALNVHNMLMLRLTSGDGARLCAIASDATFTKIIAIDAIECVCLFYLQTYRSQIIILKVKKVCHMTIFSTIIFLSDDTSMHRYSLSKSCLASVWGGTLWGHLLHSMASVSFVCSTSRRCFEKSGIPPCRSDACTLCI